MDHTLFADLMAHGSTMKTEPPIGSANEQDPDQARPSFKVEADNHDLGDIINVSNFPHSHLSPSRFLRDSETPELGGSPPSTPRWTLESNPCCPATLRASPATDWSPPQTRQNSKTPDLVGSCPPTPRWTSDLDSSFPETLGQSPDPDLEYPQISQQETSSYLDSSPPRTPRDARSPE